MEGLLLLLALWFFGRQQASLNQVEEASTICRHNWTLLWGTKAKGKSPYEVSLNVSCPSGGQPIGIFHTHPGGRPEPSNLDVSEGKRFGLDWLCITVPERHITKCHRIYTT